MKAMLVKTGMIALLIGGITLFHLGTKIKPYQVYSPTFVRRGTIEKAIDEYLPKNKSDSATVIKMAQLQFEDEIRNDIIKSKPDYKYIVSAIISFLGVLVLFFTYMQKKSEAALALLIKENHFEMVKNHEVTINLNKINVEQHEKIYDRLTMFDDMEAKDSVIDALTLVAKKHLFYNRIGLCDDLKLLIDSQAERLISLSKEIMVKKFDAETYSLTVVKIEQRNRQAWKQVEELFGKEFLALYKVGQKKAVEAFKKKLQDIVADNVTNSKLDRYRASAETFLQDIICNTIEQYQKFTNKA